VPAADDDGVDFDFDDGAAAAAADAAAFNTSRVTTMLHSERAL
jgi:hypothetical protein